MRFTKMHGCGNDYVFLDGWREKIPTATAELSALAQAISDRHTGVGSDGLILVGPSLKVDARMLMFNSDGSESEMCGNGLRCAAKLAYDAGHARKPKLRFETGAGILSVDLQLDAKGNCGGASVDMGPPRLTPAAVPVEHPGPGPLMELRLEALGVPHRLLAVGMGNPHAVCFVDDAERFPVQSVGPVLENHPRFPRRANIEFVSRMPDAGGVPVLRLRTWERGAGETQACGTGACAAAVAAILDRKVTGREMILLVNGGFLRLAWPRDDAGVILTGPAVTVFSGEWP